MYIVSQVYTYSLWFRGPVHIQSISGHIRKRAKSLPLRTNLTTDYESLSVPSELHIRAQVVKRSVAYTRCRKRDRLRP